MAWFRRWTGHSGEYRPFNRAELEHLIEKSGLTEEQKQWLRDRWLGEAEHMHTVFNRSRVRFARIRLFGVFSSLITPVVAGVAATSGGTTGSVSRWATLIVAIIGAVAIAADQVQRDGARWRLFRRTYHELMAEGWSFFSRQGKYSSPGDKQFDRFFTNVEKTLAAHERTYSAEVAGAVDTPIKQAENGSAPGKT